MCCEIHKIIRTLSDNKLSLEEARQAVTKNTPFGKTGGEKMNKSEKKTIDKMVEKQIGKLVSLP